MKKQVFDMSGKRLHEITLDSKVWGVKPHEQALHDVVVSQLAANRQGSHNTKTRGEVSGGGRKPWKQKGTGRARQGSIRSPQWRGGGVVFGPKPNRNYTFKINRKVKKLAIRSALSLRNKNIIILDKLAFANPSTKEMIKVLNNLKINDSKILVITNEIEKNVNCSLRNIPKLKNIAKTSLNVYDILNAQNLLITEDVIKRIEEVYI